jgi:serine-type D-Ala-D-Ala carboxypeptidase/endopeptidase
MIVFRMQCLLVVLAMGAVQLCRADSSRNENLQQQVDGLARSYIEERNTVGIVVGIVLPEEESIFGYGKVAADSEKTPDRETIFEIGSVTKVFTAVCLAQMVQSGVVKLEDPLQKHLPPSVKLRSHPGLEITLLHLATHTSGLPRAPLSIFFKGFSNPYAEFGEDELYTFLASYEWLSTTGTKYSYSNLGVGLLGHLLARKAGTDFETLVVKRVCEPLGMRDTRITLTEAQRSRLAKGYTSRGQPAENWNFDALAGAGALRSTASDMLRFAKANLVEAETPLSRAMALSHEPQHSKDREGASIGLVWGIEKPFGTELQLIGHNGSTGGYSSFLGLIKSHGIGVVVLTNTSRSKEGSVADELGFAILKRLTGG